MYRMKPELRLRRGPSESFWAFDLETGEHFELNETAFTMLEAIGRGVEPETIAVTLAKECGVHEASVKDDMAELLRACLAAGLVTREA